MQNVCLFGDFFTDGNFGRLPYSFIDPLADEFQILLYVPYSLNNIESNIYKRLTNRTKVIPWSPQYHQFPSYPQLNSEFSLSAYDMHHITYQYARLYRDSESCNFAHEVISIYGSIGYWINVLSTLNIDVAISMFPPHFVYDYTFFIACKFLDIPFRTFNPISVNPERKFLFDLKYKLPIKTKQEADASNELKINLSSLHFESAPFQSYTKNSLGIQQSVKQHAKQILISGFYSDTNCADYACYFNSMVKEYQSAIIDSSARLLSSKQNNSKCILVTLHMQPEASTSPCGIFPDQRSAIYALAASFPDHLIIVKEHPIQMLFLTPNRAHLYSHKTGFRFKSYYRSLLSCKNICFVRASIPVNQIIEDYNLSALATYSGSPALSALVKKIPVISFGIAAYTGYAGVINANKSFPANISIHLENAKNYLVKLDNIDKDLEVYMDSISFTWHFAQTDRNGKDIDLNQLYTETRFALNFASRV